MTIGTSIPLHIVSSDLRRRTPDPQPKVLSKTVVRTVVGFDGAAVKAGNASAAQIEALAGSLEAGEYIGAQICLANSRSAALELSVVGRGETAAKARSRARVLDRLFGVAVRAALPGIVTNACRRGPRKYGAKHEREIIPAGTVLPLASMPVGQSRPHQANGDGAIDWDRHRRDAIVFSAIANGAHLLELGAVVASIKTPLTVELRLSHQLFDSDLNRQLSNLRGRVEDRQRGNAESYMPDERYIKAHRHLEGLIQAGWGVRLVVTVRSRRALEPCEMSALSAAMFGTPHDEGQSGHLASLRNLHACHEGTTSFLGIVAAAVGPVIERRQVGALDGVTGNIVGRVQSGQNVRMPVDDPRCHTYCIGRPGSGKSTLLLNLILQDIAAGRAVVLIDPHGDLWADVCARLPQHRRADIELVHLGEPGLQPKLNLLELGPGDLAEARARVCDTVCQVVRRLMFSGMSINFTGPLFNKYFRAALMLLMEGEGTAARLHDIERVFADASYRSALLARPGVAAETRLQWKQILDVGSDHQLDNMTPWVTSKLTQITQSALLRPILGADTTSIDFDRVLSEGRVCLINLASGRIGSEATSLIGGVLTMRLEQAAKRQERLELAARRSASVYFDEFQTFASEFVRPLMAESRKFGLRITLANQTLSQLSTNDIKDGVLREVLGNCANTIVFGVDIADAIYLAPRFAGRIEPCQLVAQPNYQAFCQFQTKTGLLGPFAVTTEAPPAKTTEAVTSRP